MKSKTKSNDLLLHIATPFIVLILCVGIFLLVMIKPSDKIKVYLNLAFMDDLKTTPDNGIGLIIRNNDIDTDYQGETSEEGEFIRPNYGEMYAVLSTSAFSLDIPVYWGSNAELFEIGACQSAGSVIIGDDGNTVISAHEDTYFAELEKLDIGDIVTLNTNYGEFVYTVTEKISFVKTDKRYVVSSEEAKLTLYTCKKDVLGSTDERVGVICELTEKKFYKSTGEGAVN